MVQLVNFGGGQGLQKSYGMYEFFGWPESQYNVYSSSDWLGRGIKKVVCWHLSASKRGDRRVAEPLCASCLSARLHPVTSSPLLLSFGSVPSITSFSSGQWPLRWFVCKRKIHLLALRLLSLSKPSSPHTKDLARHLFWLSIVLLCRICPGSHCW